MGSINSNYVSAIVGFDSDKETQQCYRAAAAGQFNQLSATGSLAAYAMFWIDGSVQVPDATFDDTQFIWGNLDTVAEQGWGIYLAGNGDNQMVLTAGIFAASGLVEAELLLTGDVELAAFAQRLIVAGLWYDGTRLTLSVNGSIPATSADAGVDAYVPSARAATLGADPIPGGEQGATNVRIVSAGYAAMPLLNTDVGLRAGRHFSSCREAFGGGYPVAGGGLDWAHRYEVAAAVAAGTSGTITKNALGAIASTLPIAPASLADVGNLGPTPFVAATPAPLARVGAVNLNIEQIANPDWYHGGGFSFLAPA